MLTSRARVRCSGRRRETTGCLWMVARPVTCALQSSRLVRRDSSPASRHHPQARRPRAGSGQEISLSGPEEKEKEQPTAPPVFATLPSSTVRWSAAVSYATSDRPSRPFGVRGRDRRFARKPLRSETQGNKIHPMEPARGRQRCQTCGQGAWSTVQLRRAVHRCDSGATRSAKTRRWCGPDRGPSISSACLWRVPDAWPTPHRNGA